MFRERNQELYKAGFGAQFISGVIMPATFFIGTTTDSSTSTMASARSGQA